MAARRLLIVMLVLLGISTLAAALVPQQTPEDDTTTGRTNTQAQTATAPEPQAGRSLAAEITVGKRKAPVVVAGPVCAKAKPRCEPIHVGDQLTLRVYSKPAAQLEFPEFGQFEFAAPDAPALFELLPDAAGRFGIRFASTDRVAASVQVLTAKEARRRTASPSNGSRSASPRAPSHKKRAKGRARAGSGRA